jgi:ribosomal protein L11 methyltransferase
MKIDTESSLRKVQLSPRVYLLETDQTTATDSTIIENVLTLRQIRSRAFGDGSHPTTRLCAGAVDLLCRRSNSERNVQALLDVGTGTGVLARIGRAKKVPFVAATDIDRDALDAARANISLDSSPTSIHLSDASPDSWGPRFDLVVANILEEPLKHLAPALRAALAPRGMLLLSGFTPLQVPALRVAFEAQGLVFVSESTLSGWSLLLFRC